MKGHVNHQIPPPELLARWNLPPLDYFAQKLSCDLTGYRMTMIREAIEKHNGFTVGVRSGRHAKGFAVFCDLPWDSSYFQKRMGVLRYLILLEKGPAAEQTAQCLLEQGLTLARSRKWDFVLCQCDSRKMEVIHALETQGFFMMDTLLEFVFDYKETPLTDIPVPAPLPGFLIRPAVEADREALIQLSKRAFGQHFGRFHADARIPAHQATGIYEKWLASACDGWADWIVVAEEKGKLAGFSVWKKPSPEEADQGIPLGHYSIGAVSPEYQKQGLFSVLTYEGMKILKGHCRFIEGPTHLNNIGVQRGYGSLGWKVFGGRHAFHKWLT